MKTIAEMKETVKNFLENNGFCQDTYWHDETYCKPEKYERKEIEVNYACGSYKKMTHYGLCVHVKETYRSNGTEANQSIYIEVTEWNESSGKTILREKLYARYGEKKTASILANVLTAYNG